MNCKKGDLAIFVRGPHQGLMVECLHFEGNTTGYQVSSNKPARIDNAWYVRLLSHFLDHGGNVLTHAYADDRYLRPIRDDGQKQWHAYGRDELITI